MAQPGTSSPAGAGDPGLRCAPPGLQVDHARSRARPVGDLPGPRPAHAKAELDRLLLAGLELHVPSEEKTVEFGFRVSWNSILMASFCDTGTWSMTLTWIALSCRFFTMRR